MTGNDRKFWQWKDGRTSISLLSSVSPSPPPPSQLLLPAGGVLSPSQVPSAGKRVCIFLGCRSTCPVRKECTRSMCLSHCTSTGGCASLRHPDMKGLGVAALSQTTTPPMETPPLMQPLPSLQPPLTQPPPSAQPTHMSKAMPSRQLKSLSPTPRFATTTSLNAHGNPRFKSQMAAIFTTQHETEQLLFEEARKLNQQRIEGIAQVKHTISVYAWITVSPAPCLMMMYS